MGRRKHIDRQLIAQVAYLHAKGMKQAKIGERIGKHQGTVNRLLRDAREFGIVHSVIDADSAVRGTVDNLQAVDLREAFNLKDALVVDVGDFSERRSEGKQPAMMGSSWTRFSDDVHIALANAAGPLIPIESNDHIAVAGGRAIVRLARAIALNPPSCHDITITPLAGSLWAGQHWAAREDAPNHLEQPLNPDYSAVILAVGLHAGHQPRIKFSQISHPLYAQSAEEAKQVIRHNCGFLPGGGWNREWKLDPPSKAFVGAGVDMPGSATVSLRLRMHRHTPVTTRTVSHEATPYEIFRSALELVDAGKLPFFGDVTNRLFCALPIVGDTAVPQVAIAADIGAAKLKEYTQTYTKLSRLLEQVNSRAVVMDWSHLREICSRGRVYVIAGLETKLNVLWTLLLTGLINPQCRLVTGLVTDSKTAAALVTAKNAYAAAPQHVRDWFKTLVSMIFPSSPSSAFLET